MRTPNPGLPLSLGFRLKPRVSPRIAGEPAVGALENYNFWASKGGGWALLDVVLPEELEEA